MNGNFTNAHEGRRSGVDGFSQRFYRASRAASLLSIVSDEAGRLVVLEQLQ
jgi:hypothetical protein